jgi:hypothetical protein
MDVSPIPRAVPEPKITSAAAQRGCRLVRFANLKTNAQPRARAKRIAKRPAI